MKKNREQQTRREYLLSCLKATPKQRLDWLEKALRFALTASPSNRKIWLRLRDAGKI